MGMNLSCVLAALLFFTGNLLLLIYYVQEDQRDHYDYTKYTSLDADYIEIEWNWRVDHRGPYIAAGLINAFAWFFLAFPTIQLTWVLSNQGTRMLWLHVMVGVLILAGSFTEWISRFMSFGSDLATQMIVKNFELDGWISNLDDSGLGWKTLEVAYVVTQGMVWFVDAFEWLVLFFVMLLIHISVRGFEDYATLGGCWNYLSLFISLFSLLDFIAEVLRLDGFKTFSQIAFWYAALNRLVFIPLWLFLLSRSLPVISSGMGGSKTMDTAMNQNGGAPQQNGEAPHETFTIGDD
mmetsp:Transcript_13664/g.39060  ORF Transcript_13664/g.39060 Transcript_13664/m.39060 type:complete len:293 (+) Transcript_13664:147-1025(+)